MSLVAGDDYRALCAELIDTAEEICDLMESYRLGDYLPDSFTVQPLLHAIESARAALVTPQQGAPSDEELLKLAARSLGYEYTAAWFETRQGCLDAYPHELVAFARAVLASHAAQAVPVAEHRDLWCEDYGACLWWVFPIAEPPYSGTPLDCDWPGYHTHFTRITCPELPSPEAQP